MICFKKCLAVVVLASVIQVNAELGSAIDTSGFALQGTANLNFKVSDDATVKFRGSLNIFNQLDQIYAIPHKLSDKGINAREGAAGIEVQFGQWGNVAFSGGGELAIISRPWHDSVDARDYFEVRPTGLINMTFPFAGIFKAQYLSRLERRLVRSPDQMSLFRYNSETRLSTDGVFPLNSGVFLFYRGYIQKMVPSMSQWGGGATMEPIKNLKVEGGYSMLWIPEEVTSNIFPISVAVSYTLDVTK